MKIDMNSGNTLGNSYTLQYNPGDCNCSANVNGETCGQTICCDLAELPLEDDGRILEVTARVSNICPGKRTAMAVMVHELDEKDNEYVRGVKTFTLPAHQEQGRRDILIKGVRFVLPEDISLSRGCINGRRRFMVRAIAHYADGEYSCQDVRES